MCVLSMVMEHKYDIWNNRRGHSVPPITAAEIEEFRRLLERARAYDREHNQPDCELAEKRQRLLDLAKELGVEITFL